MHHSLIKLLNGETIICSIVNEDEKNITISDPLKLDIVNHNGVPSMMTTYWIPLPDEELRVDIRQNHVIMVSDITEDMEEFYVKALRHARGHRDDYRTPKKDIWDVIRATRNSNTIFH